MANKIQILRNAKLVASRGAAASVLEAKLANLSDGEIAIARYGVGKDVKVLLGFSYKAEGATEATPFIFDADAVPADVQSEIKKLIGTESDASESVTIYGAKAYAKALVEGLDVSDSITAGSFVASVSETDGKISVTKGAVASSDNTVVVTGGTSTGALDLKANIDGTTIVKNDGGVLSVASSALTQYVGSDAIAVSEAGAGNNKTISLGINTNDKVLSQSTSGLLASLSLNYSSDNKQITLVGKNNAVISTISTNDFVKDGMLNDAKAFLATGTSQEVQFKGGKHTFEKLTKGNHYIGFEFKTSDGTTTGTSYTYDSLDATSIIDVYVAGDGLALSDHTFSVKKSTESDSEGFLSVSSNGVKVSGVQTAINTAAAKAKSVVALKENESHLELVATTDTTDDHTVYTLNTKDVASATDLSALVTASGLAKTGETTGIGYTAPTTSGVFSDTTSVMGMLNVIDANWSTIDCGTY